MPACNHNVVSSAFCPHCGIPLSSDSAGLDLLQHIQSHIRQSKISQKRMEDYYRVQAEKAGRPYDSRAPSRGTLPRWERWEEFVQRALTNMQEAPSGPRLAE